MSPPVELLVDVLADRPLRVHASLLNPESAAEVAWVPRLLRPAGAFVTLTVCDLAGEPLVATTRPKMKPKLSPDHDDSYLALEPGYSLGAALELDLGQLAAGEYRLEVGYANGPYRGTTARPVGELALSRRTGLVVG